MPDRYLQRVAAIRRNYPQVNDVQRGMEVGQQVGKMLGGLSEAIKGAQKDAAANDLMTQQNISNQPGAGQTQDLGTLPGGPQPAATRSSNVDTGPDPDPDPVQTNQPGASINPDFQPEYDFQDMPDLSGAVKQQQVANSLQSNAQPRGSDTLAQIGSNGSWDLSGSGGFSGGKSVGEGAFPGGAGTVGGLIASGGVQKLDLQKEILAQQIQKASLANQLAEAAGTGRYARRATPVTRQGVTMTGSGDSVWDNSSGPAAGNKKAAPKYVAGTGNVETDASTDQPDQIQTDFEAFHPGISLGTFAGATRAPNGDYQIMGKPTKDAQGNEVPTVKAVVSKAEGDTIMMRMDAARKRAGMESTNAAIPAGQGTQDNPVPLTSKLMFRSLKMGTWVQDKNGKKFKVGM